MTAERFAPGSLVRARGREWIVLPGSDGDTLHLRPLSGAEDDAALIHLPVELDPVTPAAFLPPDAAQKSGQDGALLLRDALLLSLRRGAGPFRSFGNIAVEPRSYQLVPLMMALKLDPVRLLVADDVGIGKTIESLLIARELLDRGEIRRIAVLCPPHLVDQWTRELDRHFHLKAAAVTASSAARLERGLPLGESIFNVHPLTVVSLDYIKSAQRLADFVRACPECVIVDEAHTCTLPGEGRHQRYELLKRLSADSRRHLVLLTATPHSGNELAFYRLLGLLDPDFERLGGQHAADHAALRERLAAHFVQRRRVDIEEWQEERIFPKRETAELTYRLTGPWQAFFGDVLAYCRDLTKAAEGDERKQRLTFWGTLALMRCVSSSPAAAVQALRTRAGLVEDEALEVLEAQVFDGAADALPDSDSTPATTIDDPRVADLLKSAESLIKEAGDPKLKVLTSHLEKLLADGFSPVVFCRYIATAHYLGEYLRKRLKSIEIGVVTGEMSSPQREDAVERLTNADTRLLIATDCLSEGINLQDGFDAVVHFDLSWNPTRHEQREGRVDRYGQRKKVVRATLIYGENNQVDGAVLQVILRKAEKIRRDLGVPVPMPDEGHRLTQALMHAVLLRTQDPRQGMLDFETTPEGGEIEVEWRDAADRAKLNRTLFAQRRIKPEEVLPEWRKSLAGLGGEEDVRRFTQRATARLGAPLEPLARGGFRALLNNLPEEIRDRLDLQGLAGAVEIDFSLQPARRCQHVGRSHPLVSILAESLFERSLAGGDAEGDPAVLGRCGAWIAEGLEARTTLVLLRLRHQLTSQREGQAYTMLVEEAVPFAWIGRGGGERVQGEAAIACLALPAAGDLPDRVREREVAQALAHIAAAGRELEDLAQARAETLLSDHRRVREASRATGAYAVKPLLPVDVIGLYVLMPKVA